MMAEVLVVYKDDKLHLQKVADMMLVRIFLATELIPLATINRLIPTQAMKTIKVCMKQDVYYRVFVLGGLLVELCTTT